MFGPKIKIDANLYERLKEKAETEGYSSVDEYVTYLLEKAAPADAGESEEEVKKRLQGLGYIE